MNPIYYVFKRCRTEMMYERVYVRAGGKGSTDRNGYINGGDITKIRITNHR